MCSGHVLGREFKHAEFMHIDRFLALCSGTSVIDQRLRHSSGLQPSDEISLYHSLRYKDIKWSQESPFPLCLKQACTKQHIFLLVWLISSCSMVQTGCQTNSTVRQLAKSKGWDLRRRCVRGAAKCPQWGWISTFLPWSSTGKKKTSTQRRKMKKSSVRTIKTTINTLYFCKTIYSIFSLLQVLNSFWSSLKAISTWAWMVPLI